VVYVVIFLVRAYQVLLSPILPFNTCRFYPSCSQYAIEAFTRHGIGRGGLLTMKRIMSCHPLSRRGGYDPVP
jgi:hypothetical protein